jgi:hypothetical protein
LTCPRRLRRFGLLGRGLGRFWPLCTSSRFPLLVTLGHRPPIVPNQWG